jgi:BON domain
MARQGGWDDRPWERDESGRDWDRWRRERGTRRWEDEPGRERGEWAGARGAEEWRDADRGRWEEPRPEWRERVGPEAYGSERRWGGMRDPGWGRGERERGWEPEYGTRYGPSTRDRPWLEPSPARRQGEDTRGLVEWEDRGPLAWLHDKGRGMTRRTVSRGPKGYTRSDERIARSGVWADDVEVKVENREVTLAGTVSNREEKWWLESLADDVFGVEEVHNRLRVARESGMRGEATEEKSHLPH